MAGFVGIIFFILDIQNQGDIFLKTERRHFHLMLQMCPLCQSEDVFVVRSILNYFKIAIDVVFGFLMYPFFSYKQKCKQCGHEFNVRS